MLELLRLICIFKERHSRRVAKGRPVGMAAAAAASQSSPRRLANSTARSTRIEITRPYSMARSFAWPSGADDRHLKASSSSL